MPSRRTTVPLHLLEVSPLNVRKTHPDREIQELADDIRAHGLLHNLVVVPTARSADLFEVVAGARRLGALMLLAEQGHLAAAWKVPVLVEPREDAREISLAENVHRIAMNPADEFEAYAAIVADHAAEADPIGYCADRQGVSRRRVEQMLRLAMLAPAILDAVRAGDVGVESARAYATVAEHERQLQVFEGERRRDFGPRHLAKHVRDRLLERTCPATDPRARYVGLDDYRAAGGRIDRDLFMGAEAGEILLDPAILDELVKAKAWREVQAVAEQDDFASGLVAGGIGPVAASWPKAPAGDWARRDRFHTPLELLRADERVGAIGVYVLAADGHGLEWLGVYLPLKAPPALLPSTPAARAEPTGPRAVDRSPAEGSPAAPRHGETLRAAALRLAAARIAVQDSMFAGLELGERAQFPPDNAYVPALTTAIGDDETYLVTVQVRVTRAELEAALPDAEHQLDEEDAARDLVHASAGEMA